MAFKPAQIAWALSRPSSTITRELKRNGWIRPVKRRGRGGGLRSVAPGQGARTAGDKSLKWSISETGRQRLKRDGSQDTGGGGRRLDQGSLQPFIHICILPWQCWLSKGLSRPWITRWSKSVRCSSVRFWLSILATCLDTTMLFRPVNQDPRSPKDF